MSESTNKTPLLVSSKEAAELLNISPRTLWTLSVEREIPHVKIGRLTMYDPADLRNWVESKKQFPGPEDVAADLKRRSQRVQ